MGQANEVDSDLLKIWTARLDNLTVSPLTRDYPEATQRAAKVPVDAFEALSSDENLVKALKSLTTHSATVFNVIQAAFVVLVSRLTGDEDVSVGTNNIQDGKPFVLRTPINAADHFTDLLLKTSQISQTWDSPQVSLSALRDHLKSPALFRFALYNTSDMSQGRPSDGLETTDLIVNTSISSSTGSVQLAAHYNGRLFSSARITTILAQIFQIIRGAAADPQTPIGGLDMMTEQQKTILPDPTTDLGWWNFRGAIHDIFTHNAEQHPDRECVIETKSYNSPRRVFTYQHINEASNLLAHHFVKSGIERGDAIMVYAYRGVDLVVAVMGVLKAGATFSVIDPAYPPDRQNVYLEVAKPRALVCIEKATLEAGRLSDKVRDFIRENLDLKTEVPGLLLKDDGSLVGGEVNDKDVLSDVQALKSRPPGVVVGPDSTPTLSFTSGSEGKPKGVRGRHFSLAYYFDWMAQRFGLSKNDKFTMLSGIAHDPIQRDIFTPLFLGAQLLVPAKDDIQNEKLAEWMKEHGPTVTHLTPAMGQILVGGASAKFNKLHHAFFVGDILIKRDCRSLQGLAPNVYIVNMYGTTETQRAVSYYEIPSFSSQEGFLDRMKDVIPAGKGMYDVQLLVVNRFDATKTCAIGEIGEIYVRASGLAEGYLGTPELTAKKFVANWFVDPAKWIALDKEKAAAKEGQEPWREFYLGPRDRLYRSGDLGRYTPTGEVECSGRADDQVKIRGFRIELGEIDTHLSQHPLVRENITLVRRDKFEEQTLVSYVVPDPKEWRSWLKDQGLEDQDDDDTMAGRFRRYKPLQDAVREHLKGRLPVYAVPSVIVPMRAMPLNPNGKIDKPKLPFPDITALGAARRTRSSATLATLSETELGIAQIWAKLIPGTIAKTVRPTDSFFDLGGTSMHAQQIPFNVRRTWPGIDITISQIYANPTLKAIASIIDQAKAGESLEGGDENSAVDGVQNGTAFSYYDDAVALKDTLPKMFPTAEKIDMSKTVKVFLTGATGFLGVYLLRDLLSRQNPSVEVTTLVRARSPEDAFKRVKGTASAYGVWSDSWVGRIHCVCGSLGAENLGVTAVQWEELTKDIDVVIHNGAQVHWVHQYLTMKPANVQGTIDCIRLCATGKAKQFAFVSSTSALDHDYFVRESDRIIAAGGEGISESDDMMGSAHGLGTGYGQTKWVSEYLSREAGKRGLKGTVVRAGYVLGDSKSGVTNTDDFLIRMMKGCIQLRGRPNINNTVNMVPVDHVARIVVSCAFHPPVTPLGVAHVTGHPRLRFNQFLAALESYGYDVPLVDYVPWAQSLEEYVNGRATDDKSQHALLPLFTFVANDLPSNTRAPELDDRNTEAALYADREWSGEDVSEGTGVSKAMIGNYLAYLVATGFLPPPTKEALRSLPKFELSEVQREALQSVGGRGGSA
ncbi:putative alpha-aminoadipate reductase large [Phaeomoniella chlamydospora]|uniref:Alpha-aminoadipate reductase n=1 Tax=Phaeomoniella chlamydospora TaxID=158046 RepID=A0A0G2F3M6_PHACM|nr:putative alpha-aminoadipate reductase large [Phaeomoniella chlamydospora]